MNEEVVICLAIDKPSRSRYRKLLSNPKKRGKVLDGLNHNPPLDSRFTKWHNSFKEVLDLVNIEPSTEVFLLSASSEIDGKKMSYIDAIEQVPLHGWGTIIGISKNLAIYYGEHGERAAIIEKVK